MNQNYTYTYVPNLPKTLKKISISLGWNCEPAGYGVKYGLRDKKENGYKTCPFDEMVSNLPGVVECLKDNFKYFMDDNYLELKKAKIPHVKGNEFYPEETLVYNTKYNFYFNHESPGHGNLYLEQQWTGGINHYIDNNFYLLKERYNRRVQAFRDYIQQGLDGTEIIFIVCRYNKDVKMLDDVLKEKYPTLRHSILVRDPDESKEFVYKQHIIMGVQPEIAQIEIK
jgi:hypothetical protein